MHAMLTESNTASYMHKLVVLLQVQADVELLRQALPYYVTDNTGITDLDNLLDQVGAHTLLHSTNTLYMHLYITSI
jgi:hypothetical protein